MFHHWRENMRLIATIPKPQDCLVKTMTCEEAKKYAIDFFQEHNFPESDVVNWENNRWQPFIKKFKPAYELWFYSTPEIYWKRLMGRDGFIIIDGASKLEIAQLGFRMS